MIDQNLNDYIQSWLPKADLLPITKKNYESVLRIHVLPRIGERTVGDIRRADVRQLLDELRDVGISSSIRSQAKASLGSALQALVDRDELESNPTHKIRIKKLDSQDLRNVLDPEDFKTIRQNLRNDVAALFADFLVLSGCRFGEASELRLKDVNFKTNEIYIQRRVSDLGGNHNNGSRFRVIEATKSGRSRAVVVTKPLMDAIKAHSQAHGLAQNDLLFPVNLFAKDDSVESVSRDTNTVETFVKNKRLYTHGTQYAYVHGLCRCEQCRDAMRKYRASQRLPKVNQRPATNTTGHLPRDTWRLIWLEAIAKSNVEWSPRTHDLRHANATLLLKNGVDVNEVKERLGHSSIKTTERYLHRLRHQRSKAAEAVADFLE